MKAAIWKKNILDKYYHLLAILLIGFIVFGFMADREGRYPILPTIFVAGILFSLRAVEIPRLLFIFSFILGSLALALDFMILQNRVAWTVWLQEIPVFIYMAFLSLAIILLLKKIFTALKVTSDTICGGVCVYLLIGFLWAVFYSAIYIADPGAFVSSNLPNQYSLMHFSFITMTTVGYGDIQPVNKLAMVLSNLEAIAGQMYIAIFVTRLVNLRSKEI